MPEKTVRIVKQSDEFPSKDTVILDGRTLPWFRTAHGVVSEGDTVRIENGRFAGVVEG